jgi:hypothetical protein
VVPENVKRLPNFLPKAALLNDMANLLGWIPTSHTLNSNALYSRTVNNKETPALLSWDICV